MGELFGLLIVIGIFFGVYEYFTVKLFYNILTNIINGVVGFFFLGQFLSYQDIIPAIIEIVVYCLLWSKGKQLVNKHPKNANHVNNYSQGNVNVRQQQQRYSQNEQANVNHTTYHTNRSTSGSSSGNTTSHEDKFRRIQLEQIKKAKQMEEDKNKSNSSFSNSNVASSSNESNSVSKSSSSSNVIS